MTVWKPMRKSEINKQKIGKKIINLLSLTKKGRKIAPAIKGVKLGGWGISLLKISNTQKKRMLFRISLFKGLVNKL